MKLYDKDLMLISSALFHLNIKKPSKDTVKLREEIGRELYVRSLVKRNRIRIKK